MNRWTLTNSDTSEVQVLDYDPKGWDEVVLTHERDDKWHGVFFGFSQELGFFCKGGGKEFIDAAYDDLGQEANMRIKLETECNGQWSTVMEGKVNFSSYRQEYISNVLYTWLNVENDDIATLLKNREDTKVNLLDTESLGGVTLNTYTRLNYDVNLHSKYIKVESNWTGSDHNCCYRLDTAGLKQLYALPKLQATIKDFPNTRNQDAACGFDAIFNGWDDSATPIGDSKDSIVLDEPQQFTLSWVAKGRITFTSNNVTAEQGACEVSNCGSGGAVVKLYDTINPRLRLLWGGSKEDSTEEHSNCVDGETGKVFFVDLINGVDIPQFAATSNPITKSFDKTSSTQITINPGDKIWFQWVIDMNVIDTMDLVINFDYDELTININGLSIADSSTGKATCIYEAWSRLTEIITDQPLAFKSEFFGRTDSQGLSYNDNGYGGFTALTPGKAIRGFTDYRFETSLKDMFESCWAVWGTGLGVETHNGVYVARVEEMDYFYSSNILFTFDFVSRIQMRHRGDLVYNDVELGYAKWETENVNGLDEPNTSATWTATAIKSNKNKFSALSPYVAGMYALELTRRRGISTEDSRYDEEIFFICLSTITNDNSGYNAGTPTQLDIPEKDEHFSNGGTTGLISPATAYNLRLMPSMNYQRLVRQFCSGWTKVSTFDVKLSETKGNISVIYSYAPTNEALRAENYPGSYGSVDQNVRDRIFIDPLSRSGGAGWGLPLWEPEEYTFEYPLPFSQYLQFLANPYGLIRFSDTDKNYLSGWVTKLEYNLKYKTGNFTILRKYGS